MHVFRFPVIPVASRCLSPFVAPLKLKKKPRPLIEAFLESDTRSGPGRGRCSFNNDVSRDVKPEGSPPRQSINWLELFEKSEEMSLLRWKDEAPVNKSFYIEHPDAANRLPREVAEIRKQNNNIVVNDLNEG